ncbi:MAG: sigma-70 family RNA polymerase sigma factor [Gemmatimonadales bacterium]
MKHVEDAVLATRSQAGHRDAFGELVSRYAGAARRAARAVLLDDDEADDAAQDGFLSAWRNISRFDPARPFGPWLLRIVANAATDRLRRRRVRRAEVLGPTLSSSDPSPAKETERLALGDALRAALAELPERQRTAVVLFDVEGYSAAEIGRALKIPEGTVRSDVFHARRALRRLLADWHDEGGTDAAGS